MVLSWSLLPGLAGGGGGGSGGGGGGGARASSKAVYDFRLDEQDWDKVCWGRVDKAAARSLTHQLSRRAKWAAVLRAAAGPQGGGWAPDFTADEMTPGRLQALARVIDAEFFQGSFHRTLARRLGRPLMYRSAFLEPGSAPVGDAAMSAAVAGHAAEVAVAGHTAGVAVAPSRAVAGALAAAAAATAHPARCGCCNSSGNSSSSCGNSSSSGSSSSRGLAVLHRAAAAVAAPGARVPVTSLALSPAAFPSVAPTATSLLWQHSLHLHRRQQQQQQQLFATAAGAAAAASAPLGFRGQPSATSAAPAAAAAGAAAVADRGSHLLSFSLHSTSSSAASSSSSSPSSSLAPPSAASPPLLVCSARARSRRLRCGLPPPLVLVPPPAWEGNRGGGGGGGRRWQLTDKGRIRVLSPEPSEPPGGPGQVQQLGAQEVCGAGMRGGGRGGGRCGGLRRAAAGTGVVAAAGGAEAAAAGPVAAGGPSATYSHGQGSVTFWQQVWDSYSPSVGRPVRLDGVVCDTKLSWLAHTLGHEMLHALLFTMCSDTAAQAPKNMSYQGHGHNFLVLNWALYGHRGHVYEPAAGWRPAPAPPLRL
ncbi:hypothetical protein CHLRE_09g402441v5 [Chlamydomonas reinhardtii]|uniref:Uncharacterized protein n=1 Tax=Chlamydomonas reinhardtii TaxID=3055 RepID=A0A2K3DF55_CHLRE|nr:uncharacterized protein CHLRE_09g402441v5 [Chlamydomonas reinhardtii]PNW79152.1 hypothetical protein CHLRE_09g402441v5 [Chlamydomonas reinhardtii]